MLRFTCLAIALCMVGAAKAGPFKSAALVKSAPLVDPVTLKMNAIVAARLAAERKAQNLTWDTKVRRTMSDICRGC